MCSSAVDLTTKFSGTTLGALIVGLGLLITGFAKFNNPTVIIVGLISGALWAFGQANQLKSISLIGVSNTMPVSTGMQLVGTTLFSVIFLGEWSSMTQIIFGLIAMILLVTGVALTSLKAKMNVNQIILNLKSNGYFNCIYSWICRFRCTW